jgi:hypothetical protein
MPGEKPRGDCYRLAANFLCLSDQDHQPSSGFRDGEAFLVHGSVENPDGTRIRHAWVEHHGAVWEPTTADWSTSQNFSSLFKPIVDNRYSPTDVTRLVLQTGNYGPWLEEERKQAGAKS